MKVLIIEDDLKLKKYIKEYLEAYSYMVEVVNDFSNVMEQVEETKADLILLDINLPIFDGLYFLKLIRKKYKTPIIIVSARNADSEQIMGMELGADDYITKPFSMGVLLAKINAVLRRVKRDEVLENDSILEKNNISLNYSNMKLTYKGNVIELSKNECRILKILIQNMGSVVSRDEILEEIWDDSSFVDDNTLTVNMTRIKRRLDNIGLRDVISTKRGVGYIFNEDF